MQSLRNIMHKATMGLSEINQMAINPQLGSIRVHLEAIQSICIDELRKIDIAEDKEDNRRNYPYASHNHD